MRLSNCIRRAVIRGHYTGRGLFIVPHLSFITCTSKPSSAVISQSVEGYRDLMENFVGWCGRNHLPLNIGNTGVPSRWTNWWGEPAMWWERNWTVWRQWQEEEKKAVSYNVQSHSPSSHPHLTLCAPSWGKSGARSAKDSSNNEPQSTSYHQRSDYTTPPQLLTLPFPTD